MRLIQPTYWHDNIMHYKLHILWTDSLIYFLIASVIFYIFWVKKHAHHRAPWRSVFQSRLGIVSFIVLMNFVAIGVLDSIHFREALTGEGADGEVHYSATLTSLFDLIISPLGKNYEKTYSKPFARKSFSKEFIELPNNTEVRDFVPLKHTVDPSVDYAADISKRVTNALFEALALSLGLVFLLLYLLSRKSKQTLINQARIILKGNTKVPWRTTISLLALIGFGYLLTINLAGGYHLFGTDKVGQDVFFQALKSIRTGLVIGTLTTLVMLPFAVMLGIMAGYFGGLVDDVIQYIYTTLSSIPAVLLIAAAILSIQVYISNHPDLFHSLSAQADARLLSLCIILGITSWTSLCRILRGETLKIREMDYIQAAVALGVNRFRIIVRHILPNVLHIILITVVLDFSGLVLAEAVLTYVGVGVDPTTLSWGNMINSARLELARDPIVWWPLVAAFAFMFMLVLSANLFSDAVRDGFDPRSRL